MKTKLALIVAALTMLFASQAFAKPAFFMGFKTKYPTAKALFNCKVCHDKVPTRNPYGMDVEKALTANGGDIDKALTAVESLDSDGDGVKNVDEINKGTWPGDKDSKPTE